LTDAAYVLINTEMGAEDDVGRELLGIKEVKEIHGVYGVYDLVVSVEADTMERLKEVIGSEIRRLENVRSTLTMIVVE